MTDFPNGAAWRDACASDAVLATWAGPWAACFGIISGSETASFNFVKGRIVADPGTPSFSLTAPEAIWTKFLEPVPPRHHHGVFAMMYRLPEFSIQGDQLAFMQHAHVARRVLEIGKWPRTTGAGVAASTRRRTSGADCYRPLCAGDCRRRHLSDL
jgi:hypothetical protein